MSLNFSSCDGCGCKCKQCNDQTGLHLHLEIENLKQQLLEKENHILSMETNFLKEADKFPNGEMAAISEELLTWQDKYSRLYEAHKRVQRVNQNLEDKLLRIVDKCETEKNALTSEVANLTRRLVDEKFSVSRLQEENERYRNDVNLAIQLLQCKPSNFVSQKYDSLPSEMQQKVRMYVSNKRRPSDGNGNVQPKDVKTIKVPIPTYPPTAMVYSINNGTKEKDVNEEKNNSQPVDIVSAAIMAKILEEREKERSQTKHCDTCTCCRTKSNKSVQTVSEPSLSSTSSSLSSVNSEKTIGKSFSTKHHKLCPNSVSSLRSRGIYEKDREKDGINHVEITVEKPKVPPFTVDNRWENDSGCSTMSKSAGSNNGVTEGILINIEPTESSSINSTISDGSTSSWPGRPTVVKSESPSDLITFDPRPKTDAADSMQQRHHPTGPRHCSVRLQVGSNNILLDNVVDQYAPILYKNKNSGDPLVHASSRSRSGSDRSSNSSCDEHQPVMNSKKSPFRTETEI